VTSRLPYCPLFPSGLLWRKLCIDGICAKQLEVAEGRGRKEEGRGGGRRTGASVEKLPCLAFARVRRPRLARWKVASGGASPAEAWGAISMSSQALKLSPPKAVD
jgi:hypothetical protein